MRVKIVLTDGEQTFDNVKGIEYNKDSNSFIIKATDGVSFLMFPRENIKWIHSVEPAYKLDEEDWDEVVDGSEG